MRTKGRRNYCVLTLCFLLTVNTNINQYTISKRNRGDSEPRFLVVFSVRPCFLLVRLVTRNPFILTSLSVPSPLVLSFIRRLTSCPQKHRYDITSKAPLRKSIKGRFQTPNTTTLQPDEQPKNELRRQKWT